MNALLNDREPSLIDADTPPDHLRRGVTDFLRMLFPDHRAFIDVRAFRAKRDRPGLLDQRISAGDLARIGGIADDSMAKALDVYVGIAERATAGSGAIENCSRLHALFSDIDLKDYGGDEILARAQLSTFPIQPSCIVASGGGLHLYWLLEEPLYLQHDGRWRSTQLLRALARAVGGDLKAAEPARILRLPGTQNFKYDPPRDVVIERATWQRYSLATLERVLSLEEPVLASQGDLPHSIKEGTRNAILFTEGCRLRHRGHSETEISALLLAMNAERVTPPLSPAEVHQIARSAARYTPGEKTFPLTEVGDAEFFAKMYAGRVCFDALRGIWRLIDDESGLWLTDPVEQLRGYSVEAMRARQREANEIEDVGKREAAWTWAIRGESTTRLDHLQREARTQPLIRNDSRVDPWDAHHHLLGVPGGVVDLRTGEQRKALPHERVTMRAGVGYDPTATSPLWENALREISDDDPEWVSYLQRIGGYTVTGDTSQDKWFIKHGKHGREGKGTIDGAWTGALGDYVLELPSAVFELRPRGNPDFDLSYLPNKRFVLSSESGNTVHLHHDRIKQMTGGDHMRVANKHQKSFEFSPTCKLWLACNDLPTVTDDSSAFWARVIVIPFRRSFLGRENTTLRPALSADPAHRRAVLAWLIKGAIDYYRDGLGSMPQSIQAATAAFRDVAWPLTPLLREDCVFGPDARVSMGDFNAAYQRFCARQGVPQDRRLGSKRVAKLMEARYDTVPADETRGERRVREKRYVGIALREPINDQRIWSGEEM